MKKIFMFALVAATFVACNSKNGETTNSETATQETAAPATENAATLSENSALAKYEEFVNKYVELYPKMMKGDAAAIEECTKLSQELVPVSEELSKGLNSLSPAEVAKFNELAQKLQDVVTKQQ